MISTIRMFESSRPENLLLFSKVFLHLNTDRRYVITPAICSTTLQKYVFDKWVNVMNKLRHKNALVRKSKAFYRANLLGKCLGHLRERVLQKNMRVEVSTILEGYRQGSTIRRCFNGIREYARQRSRMHQAQAEISESRAISLLQRSFCNWYNKLQLSQSIRQTESSLTDARDFRLMKKALQAIKLHYSQRLELSQFSQNRELRQKQAVFSKLITNAQKCQERRSKRELVTLFRRQHLLRQSMLSLIYHRKLSASKFAYSKKFSVFTAWKSLTKENRLLTKYLKECNFQSKPRSAYQPDLSSIRDEETKEMQLSFADASTRQYATVEVSRSQSKDNVITRQDLNYLYGCQPQPADLEDECQVETLVSQRYKKRQ